tara:strand:- start:89 stop:307 length:219 start_codon:yes stop_codon:yes gene_type:complete
VIDIRNEVVEIIEDRLRDTIEYNSEIFNLTEDIDNNYGGHGNIIDYLKENKLTVEELQSILLCFIQALHREI